MHHMELTRFAGKPGTCGPPGKRCWLAFKDLFLQGDETQKDHLLIVYIIYFMRMHF